MYATARMVLASDIEHKIGPGTVLGPLRAARHTHNCPDLFGSVVRTRGRADGMNSARLLRRDAALALTDGGGEEGVEVDLAWQAPPRRLVGGAASSLFPQLSNV